MNKPRSCGLFSLFHLKRSSPVRCVDSMTKGWLKAHESLPIAPKLTLLPTPRQRLLSHSSSRLTIGDGLMFHSISERANVCRNGSQRLLSSSSELRLSFSEE